MTNPPTKIEKQSNTVTSQGRAPAKGSVALLIFKQSLNISKKQRKNRRCKINKMSFTSFPKKRKLFTVLRSPHIDKKSREQFQFVFHKLKLVLNGKNDNKTNLFIFLLKNSEFPGVEMEIILNYHSCLHCL